VGSVYFGRLSTVSVRPDSLSEPASRPRFLKWRKCLWLGGVPHFRHIKEPWWDEKGETGGGGVKDKIMGTGKA
jgi:hypothetical protein